MTSNRCHMPSTRHPRDPTMYRPLVETYAFWSMSSSLWNINLSRERSRSQQLARNFEDKQCLLDTAQRMSWPIFRAKGAKKSWQRAHRNDFVVSRLVSHMNRLDSPSVYPFEAGPPVVFEKIKSCDLFLIRFSFRQKSSLILSEGCCSHLISEAWFDRLWPIECRWLEDWGAQFKPIPCWGTMAGTWGCSQDLKLFV